MRVAIITALLATALLPVVSLAQTASNATSGTPTASTNRNASESENAESQTPVPPPPASPHDPNAPTIAELNSPDDNELSRANTELLAKNSELQGRIDELTTQVNVLVNERSGQLFLYGVISTLVSFILGFILASLIMKRK
ncbi:hypothetical protein LP123_04265 [Moraxella bovis]|uniref:SH3 domain protein n=1 Tax=Moraxella bovis TaxID=476 RepID=A0AAQ2Q4I6_MORBO|nr:hypothetical protein [Moraxella bovis]AWY19788.1 hypothetical protein DQF64_04270 [Moraxella bovis]OOR87367.1 hypothetical protein B0182_12620 [Moraxella bovis]UYZ75085.1 hypothetical protein LP093_09970 [Moraxella bovis]UYZ78983.1 hypothetical protein LP115_03880 [Moraxella bovis]UYZ80429.1 hypothetical protein LP113_10330 [Moraxella bovis]